MRYTCFGVAALIAVAQANMAYAKDAFDGKGPLLCTIQQLHECDGSVGCEVVPPQTAEDIRHLTFNFKDKTVRLEHWDAGLTSAIQHVDVVDDNLIVQGVDSGQARQVDGAGWTMSLNRSYGTMVMTVAGRDVAFVGVGSCIPTGN